MTAAELNDLSATLTEDIAHTESVTNQATLRGLIADQEGRAYVARILERKRLIAAASAADDAYTAAVEAAVAKSGDWYAVRVAAEVVRQTRAAIKAAP